MSIYVKDVLTGREWVLPNTANASVFYMGQLPPGEYDIKNGSFNSLAVVHGNMIRTSIPPSTLQLSTVNVNSNENTRSWSPNNVDYAIWQKSGHWRGH